MRTNEDQTICLECGEGIWSALAHTGHCQQEIREAKIKNQIWRTYQRNCRIKECVFAGVFAFIVGGLWYLLWMGTLTCLGY